MTDIDDTQDTIYTYQCPKCKTTMQLAVKASAMMCRNGHDMRDMKLIETRTPTTERVKQEDPFTRKPADKVVLKPGSKKVVKRKQGARLLIPGRKP